MRKGGVVYSYASFVKSAFLLHTSQFKSSMLSSPRYSDIMSTILKGPELKYALDREVLGLKERERLEYRSKLVFLWR